MRKNMVISAIIIICLAAGYYLVAKTTSESTTSDGEENMEINSDNASNDNEKPDEEGDDESGEDQREIIEDLIDESEQFPSDYVTEGEECKATEDTLERGDCFQEVNENYLDWVINTDKRKFYFPYQNDQDHWDNVFYYSIGENDELDTLHESDYYDTFTDDLDSEGSQSKYELAKDAVNENWRVFSHFIPEAYREDLKYVYLTDTGEDFVFGVGRSEEQPKKLTLLFSHLVREYIPIYKTSFLHEFGHVLTLNEQQVNIDEDVYLSDDEALYDKKAAECDTYYVWSCVKEDSYLYAYYQQFWEDISTDYESIDWEDETDFKDFFFENEERFMNSYQGTSPEEDIADAFSQYVMTNSEEINEQDEMKYDKLQFFYQYDELVELRTEILENIYDLSVEDGILY